MGSQPTHSNESQGVTPAQAGVHVTRANWIPAPRLRGDKLRGNDVTFDGGRQQAGEESPQFVSR